jgi:mannose-6-phosphate isomerase-like protein (cupin superfamily)
MKTHEDARRLLIDYATGDFKAAKVVEMKVCGTVGDHYHRRKDESFLLFKGRASRVLIGDSLQFNVNAPAEFYVPRGTYHAFDLDAGAVLLGTATAEFDPQDEVKGKP